MMIKKILLSALMVTSFAFISCNDNDDDVAPATGVLTVNLTNLDALGTDFVYEGWLIVNGSPVSTGTFTSVTFPQEFSVATADLEGATKFVLTIEPAGETGTAAEMPSDTKLLAGDFSGDSAPVSSKNTVGDFTDIVGKYILATPTNGMDNDERSGVWFLDNSSGAAAAGLSLPTLPAGWKYEGWAVIGGTPISTGTFLSATGADENAATSIFKGTMGNGPGYPGEDFIMNAPSGTTFPTDLRGATIVISVEPSPDDSTAPFTLKPLAHMVSATADEHVTYEMGEGPIVSLSGTVSR